MSEKAILAIFAILQCGSYDRIIKFSWTQF